MGPSKRDTPPLGTCAHHGPPVSEPTPLTGPAPRAPATTVATGSVERATVPATGAGEEAGVPGSGMARKGSAAVVVVVVAPPDRVRHKPLLLVSLAAVRALPPTGVLV